MYLSHEAILACLVWLVIPLLLVVLNHAIAIELQGDFAVQRLLRRAVALENIMLRQVQDNRLLVLRVIDDLALLGVRAGEELRHAIELRLDTVETFGD